MLFWFRYLLRDSYKYLLLLIILLIISPILGWHSIEITKNLFNQLSEAIINSTVYYFIILLFIITFLQMFLTNFENFIRQTISQKASRQLQEYFIVNVIKPFTITKIENPEYNHDIHLLRNSLYQLQQILESIVSASHQVVLVIVYSYIILQLDWKIIFILFVLVSPKLFFENYLVKLRDNMFQRMAQEDIKSQRYLSSMTQQTAQKDLLIFPIKKLLLKKWSDFSLQKLNKSIYANKKETSILFISNVINPTCLLLLQIFLIGKLIAGVISLGDYMAITMAYSKVDSSLSLLVTYLNNSKKIKIFLSRFKDFKNKYVQKTIYTKQYKPISSIKNIDVKNLSFKYANSSHPILNNINLTLKKGDFISIVGENGSGKSTLSKILAGLHDVDDNQLFYNNININDINRFQLYDQISVVNQDYVRYPLSVYESIFMHEFTDNKKLERFISKYPDLITPELLENLHIVTGLDFLESKQFSGGQLKRLAIARSLYKYGSLIVFDEATNELDPKAEMNLINSLRDNSDDKITIIVTHNLNIAKMAKEIIVLEKGTIIEKGSHEELLENKNVYYGMWNFFSSKKGETNEFKILKTI